MHFPRLLFFDSICICPVRRERIAREKAAKRKERAEMKAALAVAKQAE
eukprot:COSAG02_NODE_7930_length_2781_cov_2.454884_1_plen_47_part_10